MNLLNNNDKNSLLYTTFFDFTLKKNHKLLQLNRLNSKVIFHFLITETTLGIKVDEEAIEKYAKSADRVFGIMTDRFRQPWLLSDMIFNWSALKKEQDEAMRIISSMSEEVIFYLLF